MATQRPAGSESAREPQHGDADLRDSGAGQDRQTRVDAEVPAAGHDTEPPVTEHDAAEMKDRLRRALADLDNVRKRCDRELARARSSERAHVASAWLPVVDHLELAASYAGDSADPIAQGLQVVLDEAHGVFARLGYPRFEDVGEPFDPIRHEATSAVDSDVAPGTILAAVQPGYGTDEQILRPARVVVAQEVTGER